SGASTSERSGSAWYRALATSATVAVALAVTSRSVSLSSGLRQVSLMRIGVPPLVGPLARAPARGSVPGPVRSVGQTPYLVSEHLPLPLRRRLVPRRRLQPRSSSFSPHPSRTSSSHSPSAADSSLADDYRLAVRRSVLILLL